MSGLPSVEALPAIWWICDACGAENFDRCVRVEPEAVEADEAAQMAEAREQLTAATGEAAGCEMLLVPANGVCGECETEFELISIGHS